MPNFNIIKKSEVKKTFKVAKIMGEFDVNLEHSNENFIGNIDIENLDWKIGLIIGGSGTGKTSIAKELFSKDIIDKFEYDLNAVLDNMGNHSVEDITKIFYSVGFGSVPSWIKPYQVLSNGEKMRVDLANALLNKDFIVFDEFTSVIDRNTAKTACIAINKAIHKTNKKFIGISCHFDIAEWIEADWIFNTDTMTFSNIKKKENQNNLLFENALQANGKNLGVITI